MATGSRGSCPMIFVWDAETAERKHFMRMVKGSRDVSALAFSPDSKMIAAADMHDNHRIHVFDLTGPVDKKGLRPCIFMVKN